MKMRKIAIFGAGGFAREVLQIIMDLNDESPTNPPWLPVGFIVDPAYLGIDSGINGLPVLGSYDWLTNNADVAVVIAIGSPASRARIANRIKFVAGNEFATLVHPRAWMGRSVTIGQGSIICAGALITTNIHIGEHVHVNIGCTIGHDSSLENYVTLNPSVSVSGNVQLGEGVDVGTRAAFIPNANIGEWTVVGAGAVVTKPLPSNATAVGIPANVIKSRARGWQNSSDDI